jgi:SAM-dependent methyltransferase
VLLKNRYSDYDRLARVYNKHWGKRFLPAALAALEKLALCHIPEDAAILDLCCGTGQLAQALTERSYRVTGLDGSKEMLNFARKNAPGARFILDDARTFTSPAAFHLVVSVFDSLNHVLLPGELAAVFSNVHAALLEGGLFLFDLNMEAGFKTNWNGFFGIVEKNLVCLVKNSYREKERIAKFEATVFRFEQQWQRSDVVLPEKCYTEAEVRSGLAAAGFVDARAYAYDGQSVFKKLTGESERAFFICRKKGQNIDIESF